MEGGSTSGDLGVVDGVVTRGVTFGGIDSTASMMKPSETQSINQGELRAHVRSSAKVVSSKRNLRMDSQEIQVGIGVRRIQADSSSQVVIFSLHVPSWILVAKSLGLGSISLYCEDEAAWFRRSLCLEVEENFNLASINSSSWIDKDQRIFLIQGNATFCSKIGDLISPMLKVSDRVLWVSSCSTRKDNAMLNYTFPTNYKFWETYSIRHSDVGGVTCNRHRLGWSTQGDLYGDSKGFKLLKDSVTRTLAAVTKTMEAGFPCVGPTEDPNLQGCLSLDSHVYANQLSGTFRTPFQLSRTKWVKRKLTPGEIGAALDLPVGSIKAFSLACQLSPRYISQLQELVPLKLIQSFGTQFFKVCQLDSVKAGHPIELWKPKYLEDPGEHEELDVSHEKAVKRDDAEVDTSVWNLKAVKIPTSCPSWLLKPKSWLVIGSTFDPTTHGRLFDGLRSLILRRFKRNVYKSFRSYIASTYSAEELMLRSSIELRTDLEVGRDAISRAMDSSFWTWNRGSTIFFWRWNSYYKKEVRDGFPIFIDWSKAPSNKQANRVPSDPEIRRKEAEKLKNVVWKGYLEEGFVKNLTHCFSVEKGDDIRMVYDATKSLLNEACWAPNFMLPTIDSVTDCATSSSYFGDVDAAEMFLTFPLNHQIRPYAGVDLSKVLDNPEGAKLWLRWNRCGMGFTFSPYIAIRGHSVGMEHIMGNRKDPSNPFYWSSVIFNYPGTPAYDPTLPRVYKWNDIAKAIAGDQKTYVDDTRAIGHNKDNCDNVLHKTESGMSYYGMQDATRKRRPSGQRQGAWAGSKTVTIDGLGVFVQAMKSKWLKVQAILRRYQEIYNNSDSLPSFNLKTLSEDVGFLVHVSLTYPTMRVYLKGFYLTMNSWRPFRDEHGWKLSGRANAAFLNAADKDFQHVGETVDDDEAPEFVTAVPSFQRFLMALSHMFEGEEPALRLVRGSLIKYVGYGFGDASGSGFGSSWLDKSGDLVIRIGMWNKEGVDTSSNYRELRNLVETLELMGQRGELEGYEMFLFTDNSVSESVAFKGNSSAELLFELVLRLHNLEMKFMCKINIIHVAGTRMIEQGTDGLSRGDMLEGVCRGDEMTSHIPLARTALERSAPLLDWIKSWFGEDGKGDNVEVLEPEGWFERGHDIIGGSKNCDGMWIPKYKAGNFIWAPAPAGAKFAAEQLRHARHKRMDSLHVFVCPRLMSHEWISHVRKSADLIFEIKAGNTVFWPSDKHESLVIGVYLPFANQKPWQLKRSQMLVDLEPRLRGLWKEDPCTGRDILQQLLVFARSMGSMPVRDVRMLLYGLEDSGFPLLCRGRRESSSLEEKDRVEEEHVHAC